MKQDQDVQYTLLCTRCLIHSDRMRTDAVSESMMQVITSPCMYGYMLPNLNPNLYKVQSVYNNNVAL